MDDHLVFFESASIFIPGEYEEQINMKTKTIIAVLCLMITTILVSCEHTNPQLNNRPFNDYTPWWYTNSSTSVTNK